MDEKYEVAIGYGRYSSDSQNPRSAKDQNDENEAYARTHFGKEILFQCFADEGVPGSKVEREGLEQALEMASRYSGGVFVVECMSRLGRTIKLCFSMIDTLVACGWRFISRKDGVDTSMPMWPAMAAMMAACAEMENQTRAEQVRRGRQSAFKQGRNVGNVPIHYKLVPRDPGEPDGEKICVVREELRDNVIEYFSRIAAGQTIGEVNAWANSLPDKLGRAEGWDYDDGARMVRNPRYKGLVRESETIRVLNRKTGNRDVKVNPNKDTVLEQIRIEQQIVDPVLWERANEMLSRSNPRGQPHVQRYPRDKKNRCRGLWPSGAAHCAWCGSKQHRSHGQGSRYVCSAAAGPSPTCGNYLSAETRDIVQNVFMAVVGELKTLEGFFPLLCKEVARQASQSSARSGDRVLKDQKRQDDLKRKISHLLDQIEQGVAVKGRLAQRQAELEELEREIALRGSAAPRIQLPTPERIRAQIEELGGLVSTCGEEFLAWIRVLVPRIDLRPAKIPGLKKPLVQAHFHLHLSGLLPSQWRAFLGRHANSVENAELQRILVRPMVVVVTPLPRYAQIAPEAKKMADRGILQKDIARHFECDSGVVVGALKLMAQQPERALTAVPLESLPNRRKTRKPAPQMAHLNGSAGSPPEAGKFALKVSELKAQGYRAKGIACRLGCGVAKVEAVVNSCGTVASGK